MHSKEEGEAGGELENREAQKAHQQGKAKTKASLDAKGETTHAWSVVQPNEKSGAQTVSG